LFKTFQSFNRCAPFKPLNTKVGSKRSIPGFQSFQTFEELKPKRGELPRFGNSRNIEMSLTQVKVSGVWRRCHRRCLLTGVKKGRWSEAIAVGSLAFVEKIKGELGSKAMHREVEEFEGTHVLREESEVYGFKSAGEKESLSPENTVFWNESFEDART
jgi:hypothetical protein